MDEQYIIDLYNQLGGQSKFGQFENFKSLITSDPSYQKDFHNAFGESTLGSFNSFVSLVSKQQQPIAPKKKEDGGMFSQGFFPSPLEETQKTINLLQEQKAKEQGVQLAPEGTFLRQMQTSSLASEPINAPLELPSKLEERKVEADKQKVSDILSQSVEAVTKDVLNQGAESAKKQLEYYFKDAGFEFSPVSRYGFEDIMVKSPDGEQKMFSLGAGNLENSTQDIKQFIKQKTADISDIKKIEQLYTGENKKIANLKQVENELKRINQNEEVLKNDMKSYLAERTQIEDLQKTINQYPENLKNTAEFQNLIKDYNIKLENNNNSSKSLQDRYKTIETQQKSIQKAAGDYTKMKAEQGTFLGGLWNNITDGIGSIVGGWSDFTINRYWDNVPLTLALGVDNYKEIFELKKQELNRINKVEEGVTVSDKLVNEAIRDDYKKLQKYGKIENPEGFKFEIENTTLKELRDFFRETFGTATTSKEFTQKLEKEGNIVQRGLLGLAKSAPAMVGGPYMRILNMFAQTSGSVLEEMENDPDFKNISENERERVASVIGVVGAALEEFGFRNVIKGTSIIKGLTGRIITKLPSNATASQIRSATLAEIKNMGIKGGVALIGSGLAEAETGGLQQASEYLLKDIYNFTKEKEMFDTPEFLSGEYLSNIADAAATEAVGGFMLGVPNAISTAMTKDGFQALDDDTFKLFEEISRDSDSRKFFVINLKNKINQGEVTAEQGKKMIEAYDQASGMIAQVPDEITDSKDRKTAMDLLAERKKLEIKKQGKDSALTGPIQKKIDIINEQLNQLTENAIQKQAAGETIPTEISSLNDNEVVTFRVASLEDVPEEFRDKAKEIGGGEIETRQLIFGLPFGKKETVTVPKAYVYSLTGKEAKDYAIQKQAAGQVPVQSETGVGKEMVEGEPQPGLEVTPQEGVITEEKPKEEGYLTKQIKEQLKTTKDLSEDEINILNNLLSTENITIDEFVDIFKGYQKNDFIAINNILRKGLEITEDNLSKEGLPKNTGVKEDYDNISRVISNTELIPSEKITLYRAIFKDKDKSSDYYKNIESLNIGDTLTDKGFTSTTISEEWIKDNYGKLPIIKYELDAGDKVNGVYIAGVEKEFILDKNIKTTVVNKEKVGDTVVLTVKINQTKDIQPTVEFTEQDRARQQELTDALTNADKRRKNVTVGETSMPKADVKAELDALNQKELSSQQSAPEAAPAVETLTPEQEADRLEQMLAEKMGAPKAETAPVTEGKVETENEKTAKRIRGKKMKGTLSTLDFGITQTVYNGALEFMARQVESGTKIGEAITATINWIDTKVGNIKWDKESFSKYMNAAAESMMPKRKAKEILDVYPKGSTVSIVELAKETKDEIVSNVLTKMKDVFKSVKISGRRPTEGAAFYNYNTKEIDVNKNSPHWDEVEGDQIASALSHEFTHHLIDAHPEKESIENELQQIKDDLIANKPELADNQKQAYEFMTAKNNSPQEILTYAVSDPDIRQVLEKYKDKLNNISNKIFGQDIISAKFAEQTIKENEKVQSQRGGDRRGRTESREITPLEGAPSVPGFNGPDPQLVAVAEEYARENGIPYKRQGEYVKVDEVRAKRIAQAYEDMKHDPKNPKVKEAYENLIKQTIAQYEALVKAGYKFWFIDTNIPSNQEYAQSPFNAMRDIRNNKEMGVFPTTDGFGSSDIDVKDNPLMAETKFKWPVGGLDGKMKPVLANDLFRAVHDAFGHGLEGAGFRARGEENAWQAHIRLFTGSAVGAITSETRGQNSWLNFGPYAENNRTANTDDTVFADQKTGLMPEWTWKEGVSTDMKEEVTKEKMPSLSEVLKKLIIKGPGGLQSNVLGVPIAIWNAGIKTVIKAIDAGKGLADQAKVLRDAIAKGYAEIKDNYKAINKERFEAKVLNTIYSNAIEMARNPVDPRDKISDAGIKIYLMKQGLTESQADALLKIKPKTEKKTERKTELSEKTLLGYDRMINQVKNIIDKSKNRGVTEEKILENVMNYLEGSKVYENATDVQREQMVRDIRAMFGKKEKKAPTVQKILGKPKPETQTKTVNALRKEFWTAWNKSAREAKADLNTKRKSLADAINKMVKAGTITAAQAKSLINRVNKVNLDNPDMVDKFIKYAENVFNDADYDTRMQDIRKLQSQARRRKHTSMKDIVKEFTSINPELIPDDKILEYIQALDDLSTRTPSYNAMNGMFSEIVSLKPADAPFDAIKTIDGMVSKWNSINLNEVKSVEDYVNLIRDINSYKKKAYQLLENGVITQDQYDSLMETVGKDQDAVENKYEKELTELKNKLVEDIKNLKPSENDDFSNEENELIKKYLEISESDLKQLSPENLYVLNDILENIKNGEMDYYRFSEIVSKAYTIKDGMRVAKDLSEARFDMSTDEGKRKLSEYESSFWEGVLGLGRVKSGAVQKFIISPFMRAISSYENSLKKGYNAFLDLKKKYNIKEKDMHKLGMLTTYLQEYMAQFDPDNKNVKDIGTRDWFKEILEDPDMKSDYPSAKPSIFNYVGRGKSEFDVIKKIWDSLPKDSNGNVDPKAVYESYMANDGKYFTKNEKAFFDATMDWKENNLTSKQKAANELRGNPFKQIAFHMPRVRYDGKKQQIQASATGENGLVRIQAGTGKERTSQKVGAVMTNFEQLFISNLEQTSRDFYLTGALKDINNILSIAKSKLGKKGMPIIKTISQTLSEALSFEFDKNNAGVLNRLLAARAAITLLDPARTAIELVSTFVSYPFRAKTIKGYKDIYVSVGKMKELLEFTESPLRLRDNINKAIDINDGKIEPQGKLQKALVYLSGLPERTMMVTSWMPTFNQEFKELTGVTFNMKSFKESKEYREKYGKAIKEASAAADAQTEKIIGTTTKAGQRREIRIAPKFLASIAGKQGTVSKNSTAGQILGFFSNYPYREATEFLNGFREAAEVARKGEGVLKAGSQLSKPLGISFNLVTYGYLSAISYALTLILLGDDDDEERGEAMLDDLMTTRGFIDEVSGNAISLAASKYAAGGKAMLQVGATMAMMSNIKEEDKVYLSKILKNSVFLDPLPVEQATEYGGKDKIVSSIGKYVPQLVLAADRYADLVGTKQEIEYIFKKAQENGVESLTEDEGAKVLALNTLINGVQLGMNWKGLSIPMYNKLKTYMRGLKKEAGVEKIKLEPTEKEKAYKGYETIKDFKEKDPEGYIEADKDPNSPLNKKRAEDKKERDEKYFEEHGKYPDKKEEEGSGKRGIPRKQPTKQQRGIPRKS